jgi:2-succinyl-5-enolpyruvyl-6-hydroxy-3-cyclohexene-1-carboxylate synthase
MIPINSTYAPLQAFAEELVRCGMRFAVTSPGSRNAPLALSLAGAEGLTAVSVLDERSAGFVALGMAKATGLPVAVTCTSGTAAANLHPAVAEARESRVPLIVLTADRPPELRDVGAGQAIDQVGMYGSATWFMEVGNMPPGPDANVHHRSLACRAWWTALGDRPGPVHLNFPLREPLAPSPEELDAADWQGRADGRPWVEVRRAGGTPDIADLAERLAGAKRGVLVGGPLVERPGEPAEEARSAVIAAATEFAGRLAWPIFAEPTSGLRCGPHDRANVVAHYDRLLRDPRFADAVPDLVVRVGDTPTSKPLRAWLARAPQVVIDPDRAWHEPTRRAELLLQGDPAATLDALRAAAATGSASPAGDADAAAAEWLRSWLDADALVSATLADLPDPSEPKLLAGIEPALADGTIVWVSSSMAIRHVETWFPQSNTDVRFLANRGANGIDGVVSSAAGAALATGRPTVLLIGELALQHDVGGLLAAKRMGARLAIVCIDNGGGAIFDMLPVARTADAEHYEEHIATPSDVDLKQLAALAGMDHATARTPGELRAVLAEGTLVECVVPRRSA